MLEYTGVIIVRTPWLEWSPQDGILSQSRQAVLMHILRPLPQVVLPLADEATMNAYSMYSLIMLSYLDLITGAPETDGAYTTVAAACVALISPRPRICVESWRIRTFIRYQI